MNIVVRGSGSWGTALAYHLADNNHNVRILTSSKEKGERIISDNENKEFLPDIKMPENVKIFWDVKEATKDMDMLLVSVPSRHMRSAMEKLKGEIPEDTIIVNSSKGIESISLKRMSEVIEDVFPKAQVAVLSGPSHAEEVARKLPTIVVSASKDLELAEKVQDIFMNENLRVYTNTDLVGVELGGALKNVIALAAGISDGMGYGDNSKAALMTRGIREISRLGSAMGADIDTFFGLSGIGDLIVTCTSMHSRNRRAGILLGKGLSLEETLEEVHMVVEGVDTARGAYDLAIKYNVEMPITAEINKVLNDNKDPKVAVMDLMTRDRKSEHSKEEGFERRLKWE